MLLVVFGKLVCMKDAWFFIAMDVHLDLKCILKHQQKIVPHVDKVKTFPQGDYFSNRSCEEILWPRFLGGVTTGCDIRNKWEVIHSDR